jgi:hypothetical protein
MCMCSTVDHIFEVIVESITGLKLLDNMIWGEADCFIQYHFPAQSSQQHTTAVFGNSFSYGKST